MTCAKCWGDAYQLAHPCGGAEDWGYFRRQQAFLEQVDRYHALLAERREHPCSPREQAGQFWDNEQQRDRRLTAEQEADRADLAAVRRALKEPGAARPWVDVKAERGLAEKEPT